MLLKDRRQPYRNLGFLYLDVDRFKSINDSQGHACGDAVLIAFAERLRQVLRETDLVCRIGGDEFVLVLMDIRRPAEAKAIALKLLENLGEPLLCDGRAFSVSSSIGISLAPADGATPDLLLKRADAAMYEAKRRGRAQVCFWSDCAGAGL